MNQATRPSPPGLCGSEPSSFSGTTWSPVVACQMGGTSLGSQRHLASCVVIYELGTRTLCHRSREVMGPQGAPTQTPTKPDKTPSMPCDCALSWSLLNLHSDYSAVYPRAKHPRTRTFTTPNFSLGVFLPA